MECVWEIVWEIVGDVVVGEGEGISASMEWGRACKLLAVAVGVRFWLM